VELKCCERCGGLWFREKRTEIYSPGWLPLMADMPMPRRKRVVVVAVSSVHEIERCLAELTAVWRRRQRVTAAAGLLAASIDSPEWLEDAWDSGLNPDLWMYRGRTESILRKYFRMSVEVGRLPSILGSEFFRTHVTSYSVSSFEDAVIFVYERGAVRRETGPVVANR
jgi:hypothetical protein